MTEELPTVRLFTLRRLLPADPPRLVFDSRTPVGVIADALREFPTATAVLIDGVSVLQGTLRLADLGAATREQSAADVMVIDSPILEAEAGVDAALQVLREHGGDRVIVLAAQVLLGVLTRDELAASHGARRCAA